jgi:hypothetical protein
VVAGSLLASFREVTCRQVKEGRGVSSSVSTGYLIANRRRRRLRLLVVLARPTFHVEGLIEYGERGAAAHQRRRSRVLRSGCLSYGA